MSERYRLNPCLSAFMAQGSFLAQVIIYGASDAGNIYKHSHLAPVEHWLAQHIGKTLCYIRIGCIERHTLDMAYRVLAHSHRISVMLWYELTHRIKIGPAWLYVLPSAIMQLRYFSDRYSSGIVYLAYIHAYADRIKFSNYSDHWTTS